MTILKNSFHKTEYRTNLSDDEISRRRERSWWGLTDAQREWVRRVQRTLCGIDGCCCAGSNLCERE